VADDNHLVRLHWEVDADNGCFDHVAFVFAHAGVVHVLDSYVGQAPPRVRTVDPRWLSRATGGWAALRSNAVRLTQTWRDIHEVPHAPAFRGPIANVSVHVSVWRPKRTSHN
jgi:hypothetical protein